MRKLTMLALSLFALCGVAFAQDVTYTEDVNIRVNENWSGGPKTITCQEDLIIRKSTEGIGKLGIGRKVIV